MIRSGIIGKSKTAIDPKSSLCVRTASACSSHMALSNSAPSSRTSTIELDTRLFLSRMTRGRRLS